MRGPEHYQLAEQMLDVAEGAETDAEREYAMTRAQVHALLAHAAAYVDGVAGTLGVRGGVVTIDEAAGIHQAWAAAGAVTG